MNIVIIPSWYPSSDNLIAGVFIKQQAEALQVAGLNISVLSLVENPWPTHCNAPPIQFSIEEGVSTYRLQAFTPPKRLRRLRFCWYAHWDRLLKAYRNRNGFWPTLLHAHSFVGGAAAKFLSEKYKIPYIITEHYSGFISGSLPAHWKLDLPGIYSQATSVIAVSSALAEAMSEYATWIKVIPNMIDTHLFHPALESSKPTNVKRLISVGSLIPRKNFATLLRVVAQLYKRFPLELVIIGSGPLLTKLKQLAISLDIEQAVYFKGTLTQARVAEELRTAHLYVSSSLAESFALAPMEALSSGVPVVIMRCGSILEDKPFHGVEVVINEKELENGIQRQLEQLNGQNLYDQIRTEFAPNVIAN